MLHRLLLVLSLMISTNTCLGMEPEKQSSPRNPTEEPVAIALHGAVLIDNYKELIKGFAYLAWKIDTPHWLELLKLIKELPSFKKTITDLQDAGASGELILATLEEKYPAAFGRTFVSKYSPDGHLSFAKQINKMWLLSMGSINADSYKLIEDLAQKGHPIIAILGNGQNAYEYLKEQHPEKFAIFQDKFICPNAVEIIKQDTELLQNALDHHALNTKERIIVDKKNPVYYKALKQWFDAKGFKGTRYYIDASKKCIELAQGNATNNNPEEPQFVALHFTNAAEMRAKLEEQDLL